MSTQADDLFAALFRHAPDALVEVRVLERRAPTWEDSRPAIWHRYFGPADTAPNTVAQRHDSQGHDVYFGVAPKKTRDSSGAGAAGYVALVSDHDSQADGQRAIDLLKAHGLKPGALVCSGRGLHTYLLLDRLYSVDEARPIARRWRSWIGGDRVADAARVLRLPGTHNRKPGCNLPVTLLRCDGGARYSLDAIDQHLTAQGVPAHIECPALHTERPANSERKRRREVELIPPDELEVTRARYFFGRLHPADVAEARATKPEGQRNARDWLVATGLAYAGADERDIEVVAMGLPEGFGQKLFGSRACDGYQYFARTAEAAVARIESRGFRWARAIMTRVRDCSSRRMIMDLVLESGEVVKGVGIDFAFWVQTLAPLLGRDPTVTPTQALDGQRCAVTLRGGDVAAWHPPTPWA